MTVFFGFLALKDWSVLSPMMIFHLNPGNKGCAPKVTSLNVTVDNCTTVIQIPVCQGQCASEPRWEDPYLLIRLLITLFFILNAWLIPCLLLPVSWFSRVVLRGDLQVEHKCRCCQERTSERRSVTLQCSELATRQHVYKHITGCECKACSILR